MIQKHPFYTSFLPHRSTTPPTVSNSVTLRVYSVNHSKSNQQEESMSPKLKLDESGNQIMEFDGSGL